MGRKGIKKGEGQKKVLEAIDNKGMSRLEIRDVTGIKYQTVDMILKRLDELGKIIIHKEPDITGKVEFRYISKFSKKSVDPEYLKLIIENYNSKNVEKQKMAKREIISLARDVTNDLKILDKNFIDFIIKNLTESYNKKKDFKFDYPFEEMLSTITIKLKKDMDLFPEESEKQKDLLNHIQKNLADVFENSVMDYSTDCFTKSCALSNLVTINSPAHEVVFRLLKIMKCKKSIYHVLEKPETEDEAFYYLFDEIERIIKYYAKINLVDCRKKLWDAYDKQKDKFAKETIVHLIDITSLGYNPEKIKPYRKI